MCCLWVNVYCTTATGCQPNCSWHMYRIISVISYISYHIIYHIISIKVYSVTSCSLFSLRVRLIFITSSHVIQKLSSVQNSKLTHLYVTVTHRMHATWSVRPSVTILIIRTNCADAVYTIMSVCYFPLGPPFRQTFFSNVIHFIFHCIWG